VSQPVGEIKFRRGIETWEGQVARQRRRRKLVRHRVEREAWRLDRARAILGGVVPMDPASKPSSCTGALERSKSKGEPSGRFDKI
jgi:hypothetical protein